MEKLLIMTKEERVEEATKIRFLMPGKIFKDKKKYSRKDKHKKKDSVE